MPGFKLISADSHVNEPPAAWERVHWNTIKICWMGWELMAKVWMHCAMCSHVFDVTYFNSA